MRITQGTFSYLPDLTDEEITAQIQYALDNGWPVSVEYTDDPHPRNTYWEMWGLPMFDLADAAGVLAEINECRKANPDHYVRVIAYDARLRPADHGAVVPRPAARRRSPASGSTAQEAHDRASATHCTPTPPTAAGRRYDGQQ